MHGAILSACALLITACLVLYDVARVEHSCTDIQSSTNLIVHPWLLIGVDCSLAILLRSQQGIFTHTELLLTGYFLFF